MLELTGVQKMSERANEVQGEILADWGEILISILKIENKWKFLLIGVIFHKHQNK